MEQRTSQRKQQFKPTDFYHKLRQSTRHDLAVLQQKQRAATREAIRCVFNEELLEDLPPDHPFAQPPPQKDSSSSSSSQDQPRRPSLERSGSQPAPERRGTRIAPLKVHSELLIPTTEKSVSPSEVPDDDLVENETRRGSEGGPFRVQSQLLQPAGSTQQVATNRASSQADMRTHKGSGILSSLSKIGSLMRQTRGSRSQGRPSYTLPPEPTLVIAEAVIDGESDAPEVVAVNEEPSDLGPDAPDPLLEARVLDIDTPMALETRTMDDDIQVFTKEDEDSDMMDLSSEGSRGPDIGGKSPETRPQSQIREMPFTIHDVLVEPPSDLMECWLVKPRPDGKRCFLACMNGDMMIMDRSHQILWKFSRANLTTLNQLALQQLPQRTLLDGIWTEIGENQIFFVMDVVMWNQIDLHECEYAMRNFNLQSRFEELDYIDVYDDSGYIAESLSIAFVHCHPSDTLTDIYDQVKQNNSYEVRKLAADEPFPLVFNVNLASESHDYRIKYDGILFVHRDSLYTIGTNLHSLHWRIPEISLWADSAQAQAGTVCLLWPTLSPYPITADGYICVPEFVHDQTTKRLRQVVKKAKYDILIRIKYDSITLDEGRLHMHNVICKGWKSTNDASQPWRWTAPDSAHKVTLYASVTDAKTNDQFVVVPPTLETLK